MTCLTVLYIIQLIETILQSAKLMQFIRSDIFIFVFFAAFTGFETNNKYKILNSMGQQVFFAAEGECVRYYNNNDEFLPHREDHEFNCHTF